MKFEESIQGATAWAHASDGVQIQIVAQRNLGEPVKEGLAFRAPPLLPVGKPTELMLLASTSADYEIVEPIQIRAAEADRRRAERGLERFAASLGIMAETQWAIASPKPYLALEAETEQERHLIRKTKRIILPRPAGPTFYLGNGLSEPIDLITMLSDRLDGVMLLGSAIRAHRGIAALHELFRVLENGFARSGLSLVKPLSRFLGSYPDDKWNMGYTVQEIEMWVNDLRNPGTHADLRKSQHVAYDSDIDQHLPRIRQAAYDVLFNKAKWQTIDQDRLQRYSLTAVIAGDGRGVVDAKKAVGRVAPPLDHFGTYPLFENAGWEVTAPEGADVLFAQWYFSEEDWAAFGGDV
ncbi:MAG: hypothetical protein WA991_12265 [Ornithinimicrobium sp.]